jgi:hypothetical protein
VLPTTSQPKQPAAAVRPLSRAETACNADLRTRGEPAAIPTPTRVADTTTVVGVRLAPSPVGYRPQIPASAAWHHADPYGEAGSTYYLYLARAWSAVPAKNGVPEFAGQVFWVIVGEHLAYIPDPGAEAPSGTTIKPRCVFGQNITVVTTQTGATLMEAS